MTVDINARVTRQALRRESHHTSTQVLMWPRLHRCLRTLSGLGGGVCVSTRLQVSLNVASCQYVYTSHSVSVAPRLCPWLCVSVRLGIDCQSIGAPVYTAAWLTVSVTGWAPVGAAAGLTVCEAVCVCTRACASENTCGSRLGMWVWTRLNSSLRVWPVGSCTCVYACAGVSQHVSLRLLWTLTFFPFRPGLPSSPGFPCGNRSLIRSQGPGEGSKGAQGYHKIEYATLELRILHSSPTLGVEVT